VYQQIVLLGRLGRDPEMHYTADGTPVTAFSVAVDKYEKEEHKTTWFRVTAWRKLAEVCNDHLAKGRLVLVIGEVSARAYTGKDGTPRVSLEVTARDVRFADTKGKSDGQEGQTSRGDTVPVLGEGIEELPF